LDIYSLPWNYGLLGYWNVGRKSRLFIYSSPSLCELVRLLFVQDKFTPLSSTPSGQYSNWGEAPKFRVRERN